MDSRVHDLFHELADLAAAERDRIYAARQIPEAVRAEVESLLSFDRQNPGTLTQMVLRSVSTALDQTEAAESVPAQCGPYRLLRQIGAGGMGKVYLAERSDGEIHQRVAVKLLRQDVDHPAWRERFLRERQMLANLHHPAIARLLDAGHTGSGSPYLAMEYVDGVPIDAMDAGGWGIRERIALFLQVCEGVAHAHQNLVIHRDLKPSNILVDAAGRPKLLDFGIAKVLNADAEGSDPTRTVERMLTPYYASPEQFRGGPQTTATDIYSLGAVLYRLLAGRSPHDDGTGKAAAVEFLAGVREIAPASRWNADIPRDLDYILRKALEHDAARRYSSVEAMAADLRRYLHHEPVQARPENVAYRAARFVRRNRAAVALAGVAAAAVAAGVVSTVRQAEVARRQRDFAIRQLARAEEVNHLNSFLLSDGVPLGKPFTMRELMARAERLIEGQTGTGPVTQVDLLVSIGRQYGSLDEDKLARKVLERAYARSRGLADPGVRARAGCEFAVTLARSGEMARGKQVMRESMATLPNDALFALERANCLHRASQMARQEGAAAQAVEDSLRALASLGEAAYRSPLTELALAINLAESYRIAGRLSEAASASEKAYRLMQSLGRGETQRAGTLLNNWALVLGALGVPAEAAKLFREAMDISMSGAGGDEREVSPMLLLNYGRALTELGRAEGERYVGLAAAAARERGVQVVLFQSMLVQVLIHRAKGEAAAALQVLDELERMREGLYPGNRIVVASLRFRRSMVEELRGANATAFELADSAVALAEEHMREGGEGAAFLPILLVRRSEAAARLGRADGAAADARRALLLLEQQVRPGAYSAHIGRAQLALGRALSASGERDGAAAALQAAATHLSKTLGADHGEAREASRLGSAR